MKLAALMLCLFSAVAVAEPTTQPATQPTTQSARPGPAGQLTNLITADVLRIANAPEENRQKLIDAATAQLLGLKVYGSVVVDSVAIKGDGVVVTAHLPWKQAAVLTMEEQGKLTEAQKNLDSAKNSAIGTGVPGGTQNPFYGQYQDAGVQRKREAIQTASAKLADVQKTIAAESSATIPSQPVTIITMDGNAIRLKTSTSYNLKGFVSSVSVNTVEATVEAKVAGSPPYVVFTVQVHQ